MISFEQRWTVEKILGRVGNSSSVVQAEAVAAPGDWRDLRVDDLHVWGQYNSPYHRSNLNVVVDLAAMYAGQAGRSRCDCGNRKPCEHMAALMLLYLRGKERFGKGMLPLDKKASTLQTRASMEEVRRGLAQLDQWLVQLIRQGLGEPQVRTFDFWEAIADRMLAARLPTLSQWLRAAATIAVRGGNWTEPVLHEVGLMYLLVQSFQRYEEFPATLQGDLREAIGWHLRLEDFEALPVRDQWLVIGQRQRALLDLTVEQFTWICGVQSGQMALLHSVGPLEVLRSAQLEVGRTADAAIAFLPSRSPLKALLVEYHGQVSTAPVTGSRIGAAVSAFGEALANNPWLKHFPILLDEVYVSRHGKHWVLRHEDGVFLPIAPHFQHKWVMYAHHAGYPLQVAGVWDGTYVFPMSTARTGSMLDLNAVLKYKLDTKDPVAVY